MPIDPMVHGGLFLAAFLAATLLPLQSEAALVALLLAGYPPWLLVLVARYPILPDLLGSPDSARVLATWLLVFGYFFGTVFYVKTMIRERGIIPG